ncbi:S-adenosyl-L-methionine-dependent methyltransferase [Xylariaceae sp. FL0662B]|nr:S-adenosyl-L-methionine-dependent methyltransferase [Xylariaceae sp. FL0662B]
MSHSADRSADIRKLRQVGQLVNSAIETIITEWSNNPTPHESIDGLQVPAWEFYNAQRILIAAAGTIEELVCDPSLRLLGFSTQYFESRALYIAADHRIPDLLASSGEKGLHVAAIAKHVGIQEEKLSRILRLLTSQHIFREVGPETFANNAVSQVLVHNEPLRAYIVMFGQDVFSAADYLPTALKDPLLGPSYKVNETAFNLAIGTNKCRWEWLEEKIPVDSTKGLNRRGYPGATTGQVDDHNTEPQMGITLQPRSELAIFNLAMVGGGRVSSTPHVFDYPWTELGEGTVVDVGGGPGEFVRQLYQKYPRLNFVVQDQRSMVEQGKAMWERDSPEAISNGRVQFVTHDFFKVNPAKDAEVYWLRYVLHDWSDSYCIKILSHIRDAMGPNSRVLIADQVMHTTLGTSELSDDRAPEPLLANYGHYIRYSHQRDLAMMAAINGIERTPAQFRKIIEAAGLRLVRVWQCRTQVSIVECRLSDQS